jgi:predicted CXXCH cytochrome family protein
MDTDQCAGCHRAHTAPSSATWVNKDNQSRSALLLGDYAELFDFCLTCHGASAQGADTNVEEGVLETRLNSPAQYGQAGGALISGPFGVPYPFPDSNGDYYSVDYDLKRVTSKHDYSGGSWGAYGGGLYSLTATATYDGSLVPSVGVGEALIKMDCGTCHDVHGTSNYRMLRNTVYGVTVGGYGPAPAYSPTPFVVSNEPGYPTAGFVMGEPATGYTPDYTTPHYAKAPGNDQDKGMSGWCVGCHTYYMGKRSNVDGDASIATTYTSDLFFNNVVRHRHPVNVSLANFRGPTDAMVSASNEATRLPLAHDIGESPITVSSSDWVECLSCHYAHGTTAVMTGYANVLDPTDQVPGSGDGGVAPTDDSALLRQNNRYACQACHNK